MAGPGRCSEPYKQLLLPPSYHIYGVSVTPSQDMKLDLQTLKTKDPWKLFCFVGAQLISLYIIKHLQHYDSYLHSRWSEPSIITRHIPLLYLVEVHQKKPTLDISDGDKKSIKPSGMSDSRRRWCNSLRLESKSSLNPHKISFGRKGSTRLPHYWKKRVS